MVVLGCVVGVLNGVLGVLRGVLGGVLRGVLKGVLCGVLVGFLGVSVVLGGEVGGVFCLSGGVVGDMLGGVVGFCSVCCTGPRGAGRGWTPQEQGCYRRS